MFQALFGTSGAHLSYNRMSIGANDFALSYYSLDDVAEDLTLANFNIDRDRYILIPYIKEAMKINPDIKIWASPWTPPFWMKINNHYASRAARAGSNRPAGISDAGVNPDERKKNGGISGVLGLPSAGENGLYYTATGAPDFPFALMMRGFNEKKSEEKSSSPATRPDYNGMDPMQNNADMNTAFRMTTGYLGAYANYFVKFIKAYSEEGIKISGVHPQNEPLANQVFPSCVWRAEDLTLFVGKYLGPAIEAAGLDTYIGYGTINNADPNYVRTALNDPDAKKYIKTVGFQWAGKDAIGVIGQEYPDMKFIMTEQECGNGENTWGYAEYAWRLMKHYFSKGVTIYDYWNMILPTNYTSKWGWKQNSMISIDKEKGEIIYNPEFYVMKHLGHYLQPNAVLLKTADSEPILAFENPDKSIAIMAANIYDTPKDLTISIDGKCIAIQLPAHSFHSILWK